MEIIKNFLAMLPILYPLFIALAVVLFVKILFVIVIPDLIQTYKTRVKFNKGKSYRDDRELLLSIRSLPPKEFEEYVAELFRKMGYSATAIGKSHDGGIDVVIEKGGVKSYVQCKKYISNTVTVGDVRDFYGALTDRLAEGKGYFITTNKFTLEAEKFAEDKPIELIDGYKLIQYIRTANPLPAIQVHIDQKCPLCGGELQNKDGRYGKFLGCINYPECKHTQSI